MKTLACQYNSHANVYGLCLPVFVEGQLCYSNELANLEVQIVGSLFVTLLSRENGYEVRASDILIQLVKAVLMQLAN